MEPDGLGELTHTGRTVSLAEDGEESRAGQPGEDAVAVLQRCHGLHFARNRRKYQVPTVLVVRLKESAAVSNLADEEAAAAIRAHHVGLNEDLRARVATLGNAVRSGSDHTLAQDAVVAYLDGELLPHAAAEETALYPAGDTGMTAMLVRAMRDEHRNLVARGGALRGTTTRSTRRWGGRDPRALRIAPVEGERPADPGPGREPGRVLADLLRGMHELVG